MEKNNTSNFSICRKFRQALASNPALHHIRQYLFLTHSNSPSSLITQHNVKVNGTEKGGVIPIMYDFSSSPTTTKKGNGKSPASMVPVGKSERAAGNKVAAKLVEPEQNDYWKGQHSEQQGKKKSLDINDTFTEYIQRAKYRIRTVSNVGKGQQNIPGQHDVTSTSNSTTNKMVKENQKDQFSEFIQNAKKKLRTTSNIANASSFKRG